MFSNWWLGRSPDSPRRSSSSSRAAANGWPLRAYVLAGTSIRYSSLFDARTDGVLTIHGVTTASSWCSGTTSAATAAEDHPS
jgi:hypothetical protein